MPNGVDLYGAFHGSRRWARFAPALAVAGIILIIPAWAYLGLFGVGLVLLYHSVVLAVAIVGLWDQFGAIKMGFRGTRDESDFMESLRYGQQTHKRVIELQVTVFRMEKRIREIKGEPEPPPRWSRSTPSRGTRSDEQKR